MYDAIFRLYDLSSAPSELSMRLVNHQQVYRAFKYLEYSEKQQGLNPYHFARNPILHAQYRLEKEEHLEYLESFGMGSTTKALATIFQQLQTFCAYVESIDQSQENLDKEE